MAGFKNVSEDAFQSRQHFIVERKNAVSGKAANHRYHISPTLFTILLKILLPLANIQKKNANKWNKWKCNQSRKMHDQHICHYYLCCSQVHFINVF